MAPPGNDPPAFQAAINIACSCFKDWAEGRTFEGKPYVKYDSRSKRLNFLDLEEMVGMKHENIVELQKSQSSGHLRSESTQQTIVQQFLVRSKSACLHCYDVSYCSASFLCLCVSKRSVKVLLRNMCLCVYVLRNMCLCVGKPPNSRGTHDQNNHQTRQIQKHAND